jgi:predicted P-loop ATPase
MRSDQYTMTPRLCSFIATTNDRRPLTDPTGSRRYLCVEMVEQADMSGTINYRQMYAQALWEIDHGHQYWFDNDDERAITAHNVRYQLRTSLDDVLTTMFQPADNSRENFMTTTDVQRLMRRQLTTSDVPTLAKLGRALHRQHYPEGALNGIHGYYLKERQKE